VLIVVLFATGLRIDSLGTYRLWQPAFRLLAVTMPLTITAVGLLGWGLAGMTVAGAIMLGAVLAPTDPVLAGDAQVGPPLEGGEHPVRLALTAEAGLNDGLAFPFVYLGLLVAALGAESSGWFSAVLGAVVGWALGKSLFHMRGGETLGQTGPGVIALASVLLCYGLVELAEGYGFIAVFVAGLICRRVEERHQFHKTLHTFSESIEHPAGDPAAGRLDRLARHRPEPPRALDRGVLRGARGRLGLLSRLCVKPHGVRERGPALGAGGLHHLRLDGPARRDRLRHRARRDPRTPARPPDEEDHDPVDAAARLR
jgi:hypothetical protein